MVGPQVSGKHSTGEKVGVAPDFSELPSAHKTIYSETVEEHSYILSEGNSWLWAGKNGSWCGNLGAGGSSKCHLMHTSSCKFDQHV